MRTSILQKHWQHFLKREEKKKKPNQFGKNKVFNMNETDNHERRKRDINVFLLGIAVGAILSNVLTAFIVLLVRAIESIIELVKVSGLY